MTAVAQSDATAPHGRPVSASARLRLFGGLLTALVALTAVVSAGSQWEDPVLLGALAALVLLGSHPGSATSSGSPENVHYNSTTVPIVVAAVVAGPAPAAVLAAAGMAYQGCVRRVRIEIGVTNVAGIGLSALAVGLFAGALIDSLEIDRLEVALATVTASLLLDLATFWFSALSERL